VKLGFSRVWASSMKRVVIAGVIVRMLVLVESVATRGGWPC
jgi:hypothetical protein